MNDTSEPSPVARNTPKVEFLISDTPAPGSFGKGYTLVPYNPQRQYDHVRMIVTVGLLALFGFVIVWVALKSSASKDTWIQTKDMLQIILPALTALIGTVLGFYFGMQRNNPLTR